MSPRSSAAVTFTSVAPSGRVMTRVISISSSERLSPLARIASINISSAARDLIMRTRPSPWRSLIWQSSETM